MRLNKQKPTLLRVLQMPWRRNALRNKLLKRLPRKQLGLRLNRLLMLLLRNKLQRLRKQLGLRHNRLLMLLLLNRVQVVLDKVAVRFSHQ